MIFSDCNMSSFYLEHMLMLNVSAILIKLQDIITDGAKSSDNEQLTQAEREKDRDRERERGRRRDRERERGGRGGKTGRQRQRCTEKELLYYGEKRKLIEYDTAWHAFAVIRYDIIRGVQCMGKST